MVSSSCAPPVAVLGLHLASHERQNAVRPNTVARLAALSSTAAHPPEKDSARCVLEAVWECVIGRVDGSGWRCGHTAILRRVLLTHSITAVLRRGGSPHPATPENLSAAMSLYLISPSGELRAVLRVYPATNRRCERQSVSLAGGTGLRRVVVGSGAVRCCDLLQQGWLAQSSHGGVCRAGAGGIGVGVASVRGGMWR